ncbi:MAG: hypothetical protein K9M07_07570 [Simkaniaceae bacterium]|nr:hypothetical protein [Simkaniaceae bacterium]
MASVSRVMCRARVFGAIAHSAAVPTPRLGVFAPRIIASSISTTPPLCKEKYHLPDDWESLLKRIAICNDVGLGKALAHELLRIAASDAKQGRVLIDEAVKYGLSVDDLAVWDIERHPLLLAAQHAPENCAYLLKLGANPNLDPKWRHESPIHIAAASSLELTVALLEAGADVNVRAFPKLCKLKGMFSDKPYLPIEFALLHGKQEIVSLFCSRGIDIQNKESAIQLLECAACYGDFEFFKLWYAEYKEYFTSPSDDLGSIFRAIACSCENFANEDKKNIMKFLLDQAPIEIAWAPLDAAIAAKDDEMASLFIRSRAKEGCSDSSYLYDAMNQDLVLTVEALLQSGVNPFAMVRNKEIKKLFNKYTNVSHTMRRFLKDGVPDFVNQLVNGAIALHLAAKSKH